MANPIGGGGSLVEGGGYNGCNWQCSEHAKSRFKKMWLQRGEICHLDGVELPGLGKVRRTTAGERQRQRMIGY